jgi:hypothetical protein
MRARQGITRAGLVVLCAVACNVLSALVGPAPALASSTEQSILMDDNQLIYAPPAHVAERMREIASLGINVVKVSLVWQLVAPKADATQEPDFDATDPNAYPAGAWNRYDLIVQLAQELGLTVYFQLTAPAPNWAVTPTGQTGAHTWTHTPNAQEFGQFVKAAATRYSGTFVPPAGTVPAPPVLTLPLPGVPPISVPNPFGGPGQPAPSGPLPRVSWWGIWNEPNELPWLSPQTRTVAHRQVLVAPALYRGLLDAGYAALRQTGHAGDTILIGETASGGQIKPVQFIQALYCVSRSFRPLRGTAATSLSCPASGNPAAFVAAHPGLFHSAGFAHHPYSFDEPPNKPFRHTPAIIMLGNLGGLERGLDRTFGAYHQPTGVPLYLTEWGYKTDPPNPFVHTSLDEQANWLNQGEYMTWRDPRIRALAQFLLVDDLPRSGAVPGTLAYWSTFQSGLLYSNGRPKPSYDAFRIPIWLPSARHGARVPIWGELRPADHATVQYAVVDYRRSARASWTTLGEAETANPEGFLLSHVRIPAAGMVRLDWLDSATGTVYYSRSVAVR